MKVVCSEIGSIDSSCFEFEMEMKADTMVVLYTLYSGDHCRLDRQMLRDVERHKSYSGYRTRTDVHYGPILPPIKAAQGATRLGFMAMQNIARF